MAGREGDKHQVGDVIAGKYRIERFLGRGGMGIVVAARHLGLRELRAIKFMSASELRNADAVERFRREAEAASRLKSPHVVKVFDIDRTEAGDFYIVMEYLEGQDLKALLSARKGILPVHEACAYVRQACAAIGEAHAAGIVHRDLSLRNLFVMGASEEEHFVKVLDFGLAKIKMPDDDLARPDITHTAMLLGAPAFMSPEQITSPRDIDGRTDIWALGVVLYKLTTGEFPFPGTVNETLIRIRSREPIRPPSSHIPELSRALDEVVLRCLERSLEKRFQSASDLALALLALSEGRDAETTYRQNGQKNAKIIEVDSDAITPHLPALPGHGKEAGAGKSSNQPPYLPNVIKPIAADPNLSIQAPLRPEFATLASQQPQVIQFPADSDVSIQMFARLPSSIDSKIPEAIPPAVQRTETIIIHPGTGPKPGAPVLPFVRAANPRVRGIKHMFRVYGRIRRRVTSSTRSLVIFSAVVGAGIGALVVWVAIISR